MRTYWLILSIFCLLLTGCQGSSTLTPTSQASPIVDTRQISTTAVEVETTPTPSATNKALCPEVEIPKAINDVMNGKFLFVDYDRFEVVSFDLSTSVSHSLIRDGDKMISYALSPSGDFLAYQAVKVGSNQEQLVITPTNPNSAQEEIRLVWEANWDKVAYWLNQENLIIKLFPDVDYRALLFNPFSGRKLELVADFPNIYSLDAWPPDWNGVGQFVFNADLSKVIYGDMNQRFVLWDVTHGKALSEVQSMAFRQFPSKSPQWNGAGNQVIVAAPRKSLDTMNDELFLIDQFGTVRQLTDFTDNFSAVSINRYSWSPDDRYIAMLVSVVPGDYIEQLAILDTFNQKQTIFCMQGDAAISSNIDYRRSPRGFFDEIIYRGVVWSPDSQQLILENRTAKDTSRILLVDLVNTTVYELFNGVNYLPIGWIKDK